MTTKEGRRGMTNASRSSDQLRLAEEERDLLDGVFRRVASVDGVALDVGAVEVSDRARLRLEGVGRAHCLSQVLDRGRPRENGDDDRAFRHEAHERVVKRALAMHGVEGARLLDGKAQPL